MHCQWYLAYSLHGKLSNSLWKGTPQAPVCIMPCSAGDWQGTPQAPVCIMLCRMAVQAPYQD
jgi:hypothetical protein